jgi:hypothetical protein
MKIEDGLDANARKLYKSWSLLLSRGVTTTATTSTSDNN